MSGSLSVIDGMGEIALRDQIAAPDWAVFLRLPSDERSYVLLHLDIFRRLDEAGPGKVGHTASRVSREVRGMYPELRGMSPGRIRAKYDLWRKGGQKPGSDGRKSGHRFAPRDWRVLVRQYTNGGEDLSREFVAHLVTLYSETTRNGDAWAGCHARLLRDWMADQEIPGYGRKSEWYPAHGLPVPSGRILRKADRPPSWSRPNLWRHVKKALPTKAQRQAAQGQTNRLRTSWGEKLLRDRSKLLPMQLLTIDDVRLDLQARMYVDGRWQVVYIDAIFALDVGTGTILAYGLKGRALRGKDTEKGRAEGTRMSINGADVRHLFLEVLQTKGLPPYQMTWLMEMATGKLTGADEEAFLRLLGDRLKTDYTGMGRGQLLKSGFSEEWGRPGMKGWIESYFRLLHTHLNHLEGTTGRRFDLSRGDQPARIKYTTDLIKRAEKVIDGPLSPDQPLFEQLNFPTLTVDEVNQVVGEIVDALNWRTDHRLQGFDRVFEWRDSAGRWRPESALVSIPAEDRAGIQLHPRMEAPAERFQRLGKPYAEQWSQLSPDTLYALYADKRPATLREGNISIADHTLEEQTMLFGPADVEGLGKYDRAKAAVLAYIADDHTHCVIADRKTGSYLATLPRKGNTDITDADAIGKRAGEVHRWQEDRLNHVRSFLGDQESRFSNRLANNEEALRIAEEERGGVAGEFSKAREEQAREKQRERRMDRRARDVDPDEFFVPAQTGGNQPNQEDDEIDLF